MTRFRLFPLPFMFVLAAAMVVFDRLFPALRVANTPVAWFGVIPFICGVLLVAVSAGMFRRRRTTLNPFGESSALVQDGLYRYSRNPMYLGMLLILTGVALWLGNVPAFAAPVVFVAAINRWNIRNEERLLEARFGAEYVQYKQRVRRWI